MRGALPLLALAACQVDLRASDDGPRGTLAVDLRAEERPDELETLSVRVEQVVVDGFGPDGAESVAAEVGAAFSLDDGEAREPLAVLLPAEAWAPARVTLHLSARDGVPALAATGEGEHAGFVLSVLELSVEGTGALEVPEDGTVRVTVAFRPAAWDALFEVEPDDDDDDESVRIDVSRDRARYDEVVDEIARTTVVRFPEGDE